MPMPALWVDELFARLSVRYGATFARQYADLDPAAVKADWAEVMEGVSAEGIKHGLANLPADKPLNAMQFRALCGQRADSLPALPAPVSKPSPEVMAKVAQGFSLANAQHPKDWARRLKAREESGERLTRAQREMWRAALEGVAA